MNAEMEYSIDGTTYTAITENELNGLADGTYLVRYQETRNYYASSATQIVVDKGLPSSDSLNPSNPGGGNNRKIHQVEAHQMEIIMERH